MIDLMYVNELKLVNVEENILNFLVLKHYMEYEVYEQTEKKKKRRRNQTIRKIFIDRFSFLLVCQHDRENY